MKTHRYGGVHPEHYFSYRDTGNSHEDGVLHPRWKPSEAPVIPNPQRANEFVAIRQPIYVAKLVHTAKERNSQGFSNADLVHTVPKETWDEVPGMKAAMLGAMEYFTAEGFNTLWLEGSDSVPGHGGKYESWPNPATVTSFGVRISWEGLDTARLGITS